MCLNGRHRPAHENDMLTAWSWVRDHADQFSAGRCLVTGAALRPRDTGQPLLGSLYLPFPVL